MHIHTSHNMYRILRFSVPLLSLLAVSTVSASKQAPLQVNMEMTAEEKAALTSSAPTISDVLPKSQTISIFSSFCNDVPAVSSMLESTSQNITVLAPEDQAVKRLGRKPWEDPADYDKYGAEEAYKGQTGVDRAQQNLKRFVEAHLVAASPWSEGEKAKRVSGEGGEIWWETKDGKKVIQPGNVEVVQVADKVSNGEVWVIKDVLNYAI